MMAKGEHGGALDRVERPRENNCAGSTRRSGSGGWILSSSLLLWIAVIAIIVASTTAISTPSPMPRVPCALRAPAVGSFEFDASCMLRLRGGGKEAPKKKGKPQSESDEEEDSDELSDDGDEGSDDDEDEDNESDDKPRKSAPKDSVKGGGIKKAQTPTKGAKKGKEESSDEESEQGSDESGGSGEDMSGSEKRSNDGGDKKGGGGGDKKGGGGGGGGGKFQDMTLQCRDCDAEFTFTVGEQEFYEQKGFDNKPTRCSDCKAQQKGGGGGGRGGRGGRDGGRGGGGGGVCFAYQKGDCNRGDSCKFSHSG